MTTKPQIHPSDSTLDSVEKFLRAIPDLEQKLVDGVARAIDEVIDPVRSARWTIAELDKPEKTVFGIRVENVLRMELELERSPVLDVKIAGENVDIKFTVRSNWTIPPEAHDEICLVARFKEINHAVSVGLVRVRENELNPGKNRDAKSGLNPIGMSRVRWLVKDQVAKSSIIGFMAGLPLQLRRDITDPHVGAQTRLNRLFVALLNQKIPETLVEAVSQHRDWTRRMRPDASNARAPGKKFDVLRASSSEDRKLIKTAGLPPLPKGFCMSIDPMNFP
ncbi:hypothetical protein KUF54_11170 [Comamonas sp. Y33R10-2]|uniref:NaeI family type II restriction endonuclease n=1 Tax=Comamonas sp. Y33R10-2 TaxID=2853257 RepID=UPI001C5CC2E5|nr:NaeI family type II restriction endonuclease [Comamonas sp. Y33R10-2]QXZ08631.1 hypothetical protein KUF54_11170 [Comamonas sp. Y33R10-2]